MEKNDVVYLFPGQGAQYQGMALDFLNSGSPAVKLLFDEATEALKLDARALLEGSSPQTLMKTDVSQPAITLANLASAIFLGEQGWQPKACAGFSLGEYAALVCSGVISAYDCFVLVKARGEAMQKCADKQLDLAGPDAAGPEATPGMAAVVGLSPSEAEALLSQWGIEGLYLANLNSPRQVVVSGAAKALEEAGARFKEAGAKRFMRLKVSGPFHSPLMATAADEFGARLEGAAFNDPSINIYSNVTGKRVLSGPEAKTLALAQIYSPVRWLDVEASIASGLSFSACLEAGPGKVLQGLWKDFLAETEGPPEKAGCKAPCLAAGTVEDINKLIIEEQT
jgi:[acyl-carrier-protein] S-malonyltransferase